MRREFVPFNKELIDAEFAALERSNEVDAAKLDFCMNRYENSGFENPHPAVIKPIDQALKEVRHAKDDYAGRCIFFDEPKEKESSKKGGKRKPVPNVQKLIILRIFRKEGQKTPPSEI